MPIGMALGDRWEDQGRQLNRLTLKNGGDLPGMWVVVDREFVPWPCPVKSPLDLEEP
jgi:hypothetical protein